MVLESGVVLEEIAAAMLAGDCVALVVPEFGQAVADGLAVGNFFEITEGYFVFGFDPGVGFGGVGVFEPAVGIADLGAVIVVNLVSAAGLGILEGRGLGSGHESHN